ncbi:hypothetical protein [Leyella stercorea]|uniref:hypothetical protein n=1 Tax=Leyella stercorea TaxID=363265 RepID=UPI002432088F|nr:hypothetical protein [Leyella stercorea]
MKIMDKTKLLIIAFTALISQSIFTACDHDDDEEWRTEDNDNSSDENNGSDENNNSDNMLIGNWYNTFYFDVTEKKYYCHDLFSFSNDMKYKYSSVDSKKHVEEGVYRYTSDSLFLTSSTGGHRKYKLKKKEDNVLWLNTSSYTKSTLTGLEANDVPDKSDPGLTLKMYNTETGDLFVQILPHWGMNSIYYSLSEKQDDKKSKSNSGVQKTYKDLKKGTKYYLTAYGIDSKGKEHVSTQTSITTLGFADTKNCFIFNYKSYRINHAEMSAYHGHSGTGTGSNEKKLRFYCSDDTFVEFNYNVAEWEGINKEWAEGTYKISRNSGYYKYGCFVKIDGKTKSQSDYDYTGKLIIKKKTSKYYTFDFTLEEMKGHFEGSI